MRKLIGRIVAAGLLVAAGAAATPPAAHALAACLSDGVLCVRDDERPWGNQWGAFADSNETWGSWNDTGDYFQNRGIFCSVRIYEHIVYGGTNKNLARGQGLTWRNIVSSNKWHTCV